jgi:hypothetical protein
MASQNGSQVAHLLIHLLPGPEEALRLGAIKALGAVTRRLYQEDPQKVRKVLRQLIWNLNEESGGIGWGMPEAFGEILAQNPELLGEYAPILVAYLTEDLGLRENEILKRGVIWALGRIAFWPGFKAYYDKINPVLGECLTGPDRDLRETAAWALEEIRKNRRI